MARYNLKIAIVMTNLFLALCLLFFTPAFATDKILDVSTANQSFISLTDYFGVFEDVSKTTSFDEIQQPEIRERFKTGFLPSEALNFGYTTSVYWLRLNLKNSSDQTIKRMLEIAYAPLADIQFYQLSEHHFQLIH